MENIISGGAPAVVHGKKSDSVFIFVHGQGGSKDEAQRFADIANPLGFQVLAVDLPGHGERTDAENLFHGRRSRSFARLCVMQKADGNIYPSAR